MNAKATKTFVTRMRSVPILLGLLTAPAKMDLSGMDTRDQVKNYRHVEVQHLIRICTKALRFESRAAVIQISLAYW